MFLSYIIATGIECLPGFTGHGSSEYSNTPEFQDTSRRDAQLEEDGRSLL